MGDSTIFTVGMILLVPAIMLVLGLIGLTVRNARRDVLPGPVARLGCGVMALIPFCAFCGLMVATAGGAIHPPLVTVAAPYVCDGTVETRSQNYSYRPGQRGVAHTVSCIGPDGDARDITLRTIGAATVYYTLIFLGAALALVVLVRLVRPRRAAGSKSEIVAGFGNRPADRLRIDAEIVRRPAGAGGESEGSIEDRLRRLQSLRDGGLISEEEYQAKRAEILAGL